MGHQPISPASDPRLRVVMALRFDADDFASRASDYGPMEVWRDKQGRWSVSPKEE